MSHLLSRAGFPIHHRMSRPRNGFGMLAVVVFVGIMATMLAISFPVLMRFEQISRVRRTWAMLEELMMATSQLTPAPAATYPVFRQRVGLNPGRMSQLIGPVESNDAVNYPTACGGKYTNPQRTNSRDWGPFLPKTFDPAVGLATPIGVANNDFLFFDLGGGNAILVVTINEADLSDILMLDQFDDNDGAAAGKIRWDNIVGSTARLGYLIFTDNAC
jgi:hypothetical protein